MQPTHIGWCRRTCGAGSPIQAVGRAGKGQESPHLIEWESAGSPHHVPAITHSAGPFNQLPAGRPLN